MKKGLSVLLLASMLVLGVTPIASAETEPVGRCPDNFELHMAMDHDDHHGHHHIGTDTDRNGDGWICVKHVGADDNNHLHTDNNVTLK